MQHPRPSGRARRAATAVQLVRQRLYHHNVVTTDLTPQQYLELQFKASSSNELIEDGLRTIRDGRLSQANRDQVFASLAAGLSRLYVLALDLYRLDPDRVPERGGMIASFDLGLVDLHIKLFNLLGLHPRRAGVSADQWLSRLSADPVIARLIEALGTYQAMMAGMPVDPARAWQRVRAAVDLDPGVSSRRTRPDSGHGAGPDAPPGGAYEEAWNHRLISAVDIIRQTIDACSRDGLLGGPARNLVTLSPVRPGTPTT